MAGYDVIWERALSMIEHSLGDFQFQVWFRKTHPFLEEDDIYYFEVSNAQHKKIMEQKYAGMVQDALQKAYEELNGTANDDIGVCFVSPDEKAIYDREKEQKPEPESETELDPFVPELDLDPFLVEDDTPAGSDYEPDDFLEPAFEEEPKERNSHPAAMSTYGDPYAPQPNLVNGEPYAPAERFSEPEPVPDYNIPAAAPANIPLRTPAADSIGTQGINPEHTFETFVVGESNMFASRAALAVANSPGFVYNPLFLYGGVGLGKTHLMHAIAKAILEQDASRKIVYVTSEKFTNELVNMIGRTNVNIDMREQFRNKYRRVDVLMIDDIQFIAGKDKTQDEFFHTFNELQTANKQIIISSDRPPKELQQLEERIVSRFEQGLIADIKMPDYETRVAILMKKAERLQRSGSLPIEDEVFHYIASQPNNIRTLEGALMRVIAYASTMGSKRVDKNLTEKALADLFASQTQKNLTPERILQAVCDFYGVDEKTLRSSRKTKDIVFPRHVAMFVMRELTELSYSKIAEFFGKKDHTTVMHAEGKITSAMRADANVKKDIEDLMARLRNT